MTSQLISREVERVRDLVRLAVNEGAAEAEARTAALAACKLIVKHGMIVLARMPEPLIVERVIERAPEPPRPSPYSPPRSPYPHHGHHDHGGAPQRVRHIRSRYASTCRVCGDPIDVGDMVAWVPHEGVAHLKCEGEL